MKRLALLPSLLFFIACGSSDEPSPEDPEFIVGDSTSDVVHCVEVNQQIELSMMTSQEDHALDIDGDGTNDFEVAVDTSAENQTQELRISPLDNLSIGRANVLGFDGQLTTQAEGTVLVPEEIDWSTDELLFALRIRNQFLVPYSLSLEEGFFLLLKDERAGWLSFQIEQDGTALAFSRINFLTYCSYSGE